MKPKWWSVRREKIGREHAGGYGEVARCGKQLTVENRGREELKW